MYTRTYVHTYTHTHHTLYRVVYGTVNPRDNEGMTPVHCAAHFGRPRHIQLMDEGQ